MDRTASLRKLVLDRLVLIMAILGAIAYIPSIYACITARMWALAAIDSLSFALFIFSAASGRFGYKVKLILIIGSSLAIAGFVLFSTGSEGAGYIWLIGAVFIASLLGDRASIGVTVAVSSAILGGYIAIVALGRSPFGDKLLTVLVIAANLVLICVIAAISTRTIIEGLGEATAEEERLSRRLAEELESARASDAALHAEMKAKEQLLRELNHRVRNNLQVMGSLLDVESLHGDGDALARMSRRVRVLAIANDIILSDPEAVSVDLRGILTTTLSTYRGADGVSLFSIALFSRSLGLDGVTDFAITLAEIGEAVAAVGVPVSVSFDEAEGSQKLVFKWDTRSAGPSEALAGRLSGDYILQNLSMPRLATFGSGEAGGEASFSIRLAAL
jgi:hypothetical protein